MPLDIHIHEETGASAIYVEHDITSEEMFVSLDDILDEGNQETLQDIAKFILRQGYAEEAELFVMFAVSHKLGKMTPGGYKYAFDCALETYLSNEKPLFYKRFVARMVKHFGLNDEQLKHLHNAYVWAEASNDTRH